MEIVKVEQSSKEWIEWRKNLITATDCPTLLGVYPYATPYQGWQRKTGKLPEQEETEAMRRGKRDEPIAREWFNKIFGLDMMPACIESNDFPFMGASLDGISRCGKYILEIKSNGSKYHQELEKGLPEFHMCQMQHQLICTDNTIHKAFYLSWNDGNAIVKEVYLDESFKNEYIPKAKKFWENCFFDEPPPLESKDYVDMNENLEWYALSSEYKNICLKIKHLEEMKEGYRKELINLCKDQSSFGSGIKILKKFSKGRVDYEKLICELDVNPQLLENCRKPDSYAWTIMMDKK